MSDAKYRSLREPIPPTVYNPVVDGFDSAFVLHVRTQASPEMLIEPVQQLLRSLDPEMPVIEIRTLRDEVEASLWQERLVAWLSAVFGAIAVLLVSIGPYGALDYAVKSRTREIGVRLALGAQPACILRLFSFQVFLITIFGAILGLGVHAIISTYLHKLLYGLNAWEPAAVAIVLSLVGAVAIIATAPAAYRAVRVDPASTLRDE